MYSWEYTSICAFKVKISLLESDQKCLRHGSRTKPLLSHCKRDNNNRDGHNTTKKKFLEKINLLWNTGHLDEIMMQSTMFSVVLFR